jgi:glycosyltransferase involved in cell wall biosynthesis
MRVLCLVDFPIKSGDRWLWNYLPSSRDEVDFLFTQAPDILPKWGKLITYYPSFLKLGLMGIRQTRLKKYDLVVAWEGKNGFPYAFFQRALHHRRPPLVILSFSFRGLIRGFTPLARFILEGVDHITVTTRFEFEYYQRIFGLSLGQISLCLLGGYDVEATQKSEAMRSDRFILAAGRSYRDYATLTQAVHGIQAKVVLIARRFNLSGIAIPRNVERMDFLPLVDFMQMVEQSQFLIVPLQPVPHAAGDIHLVQAMSASKAVVATRTPSSETYVIDGETGILVNPSNVAELRRAIQHLLDHPEEMNRMGRNARKRYEEYHTMTAFAHRVHGMLMNAI